MSNTEMAPERRMEPRVEFVASLDSLQAATLLAYIAGYRPEAFDEAVKAWAPGWLSRPADEAVAEEPACPSIRDGMKCTRTVTADGHPGLHMDADGNTWTRGDDSGDIVTVPVACPEADPFSGDVCVLNAGHGPVHEMPDGQTWTFADEAGSRV